MKKLKLQEHFQDALKTRLPRKSFIKYSALTGSVVMLGMESCSKHGEYPPGKRPPGSGNAVDVGSGILVF